MELKDAIAVYGAILSTLVAAWNVYLFVTDKGKLRVTCYIGDLVGNGKVLESGVLVYSVTNVGRKPIYVTHIGGTLKSSTGEQRHFFITPRNSFPMKLEPGQSIVEYTSDLSVLQPGRIQSLHAIDSLGRYFKVKRKILRRLVKQATQHSSS